MVTSKSMTPAALAVFVALLGTLNPAVFVIPERSNNAEAGVLLLNVVLFAAKVKAGDPVSALPTDPAAATCRTPLALKVDVVEGV